MNRTRSCSKLLIDVSKSCRRYSKAIKLATENKESLKKLRNIGILAHIDAGKTTTTERMLFYSGTIRSMGEVHHGNTVTDFMAQERERGITITAAAVSFPWDEHQFNLVDTPGHIDFTMEVEQSLGVLDGAVVVLDGSAGVEAQTLTVWRQCDEHQLPRLVYVNKMDRRDADLNMCLVSLQQKLQVTPLRLQLPVKNEDGHLKGLVDIINLESLMWNTENKGRRYIRTDLTESKDGAVWERAMKARGELVDALSVKDEALAEQIILAESLDCVSREDLIKSVRRATLNLEGVPVLCGSSFKNVGVQTLMDAVVSYLPSPSERNQMYECFGEDLCARAFKVQHDNQKGVLTYFRIFSGNMAKAEKIYNIPKDKSETGGILYVPYADEYEAVACVEQGNIAVVSGLKYTMTGDLITSSQASASKAKKYLVDQIKDPKISSSIRIPPYLQTRISAKCGDSPDPEAVASAILGEGATVPDPVFLCSIEPPSLAYQSGLEVALAELQREDPSLRVTNNEETGQTVLSGMGELHLDIIKARILTEYKINAELGSLQIAYKETLVSSVKDSHAIDTKVGNIKNRVNITMSAYPIEDNTSKDILKFDRTADSASNLAHVTMKQIQSLKRGIHAALLRGPKLGFPLVDVGVTLHWMELGRGTSETFISAAAAQCLRKIFATADGVILEPIMFLEVVSHEDYFSRVLTDLVRKRSVIHQISVRGNNKIAQCLTPLSELLGYSTDLRSMSSGTASFSMEFHSNQRMSPLEEEKVFSSSSGY